MVLSNGMINYQYVEFVPTNLPKPRLKPIQTGYYTIPIPDATTGQMKYLTTQYRADDDGFKVVKSKCAVLIIVSIKTLIWHLNLQHIIIIIIILQPLWAFIIRLKSTTDRWEEERTAGEE